MPRTDIRSTHPICPWHRSG